MPLSDLLERPLRAEDEAKLRTMLLLKEGEQLSQRVRETYWSFKQLWDRLGYHGLSDELLVMVAYANRTDANAEPAEAWIIGAVRDGTIKPGDTIRINLNGKVRNGKFISLHADKERVKAQLDGDDEERQFRVPLVIGSA